MEKSIDTSDKFISEARNDIIVISLFNVSIIALNMIINLLIARHFSIESYGQLSYFVNIVGAIRLIGALGITSQVSFELASRRRDQQGVKEAFYSLLFIRIITIIAISSAFLIAGLYFDDYRIRVAALLCGITLLYDFLIGSFQGIGLKGHVISTSAAQSVLFFISSWLSIDRDHPIEQVYLNYILAYAVPSTWALIDLVRRIGIARLRDISMRNARLSLRFTGGVYLLAIVGTIFTSYTTLWLGYQGYFADTALITVPLNLIFMCSAITNLAMTTVYFPSIIDLTAKAQHDDGQKMFETFTGIISLFTLIVSITFAVYPHVVLGLFYGTRYQTSASLLVMLSPVAYFYTIQTIFTFTMVAQGHIRASIPGSLVMIGLLCGLIVVTSFTAYNLLFIALAHTVVAAIGLVWQSICIKYQIRNIIIQTGKQFASLFLIIGTVRLLIPDTIDQVRDVSITLTIVLSAYLFLAWRDLGIQRSILPNHQEG